MGAEKGERKKGNPYAYKNVLRKIIKINKRINLLKSFFLKKKSNSTA